MSGTGLEGSWKIVAGEKEGAPEPKEKIRGVKASIGRDRIVVKDAKDQQVYVMTY
jgi:hypothetical protein